MNVRIWIVVILLVIGWGLYLGEQAAVAPVFWGLALGLAVFWAVRGRR